MREPTLVDKRRNASRPDESNGPPHRASPLAFEVLHMPRVCEACYVFDNMHVIIAQYAPRQRPG